MPFKKQLQEVVEATAGGIGAVFVDEEGEAVDHFTRGDVFEIKLTGAHHSVLLAAMRGAQSRAGNGNSIEAFSVRAEKFTYSVAAVEDGYFLVLVQDRHGIPAAGLHAVREAVARIRTLI